MTGRGARNSSQAREGLCQIVLWVRVVRSAVLAVDLGTDRANPTRVGIDDTATDGDARGQSQLSTSLLGKGTDVFAGAQILVVLDVNLVSLLGTQDETHRTRKIAYHTIHTSHAPEVVLGQVAEADLLEEVLLPTLGTSIDAHGDVALLADGAAEAPRLATGGDVGQGICQVVEFATVEQLLRHVVLQPESFGDLHLDAHFTTDIAKEVVAGSINLLSLLNRAMVQPQNNVAVVAVVLEVRACDGNGLVCVL